MEERAPDNRGLLFTLTVDQANNLINVLNTPFQVPAMVLANFIMLFQEQATPQIKAMNDETETKPAE